MARQQYAQGMLAQLQSGNTGANVPRLAGAVVRGVGAGTAAARLCMRANSAASPVV